MKKYLSQLFNLNGFKVVQVTSQVVAGAIYTLAYTNDAREIYLFKVI